MIGILRTVALSVATTVLAASMACTPGIGAKGLGENMDTPLVPKQRDCVFPSKEELRAQAREADIVALGSAGSSAWAGSYPPEAGGPQLDPGSGSEVARVKVVSTEFLIDQILAGRGASPGVVDVRQLGGTRETPELLDALAYGRTYALFLRKDRYGGGFYWLQNPFKDRFEVEDERVWLYCSLDRARPADGEGQGRELARFAADLRS